MVCENSHVDVVKRLLRPVHRRGWRTADIEMALRCTPSKHVVRAMYAGLRYYQTSQFMFVAACRTGALEIVSEHIDSMWPAAYRGGFQYACANGHVDVVELLMDRHADDLHTRRHHAFVESCAVGPAAMTRLWLRQTGLMAIEPRSFCEGLDQALSSKQFDVVKVLL